MLAPWKKSYDQPRQHIKKQRYYFTNRDLSSQTYGFSINHIWMWELDSKERWVPKKWCFWTVLLKKTLSPLDFKAIQPVYPKGNQPWIFIERADAEAEIPILWPPDTKNWLTRKNPDAGKDWRKEEKGMTEDMFGCYHPNMTQWTWVWVSSRSWWWTGKPGLWQNPGGHKELETTEQLNWTETLEDWYKIKGSWRDTWDYD